MPTLYYIMDPMCSWCYAFTQSMKSVRKQLPDEIELHYIMGGLAPDSDEPMAPDMQQYVQQAWQTIATRTGLPFNFDFWTHCQPRRSTYPACRAVLAAGLQGQDKIPLMIEAIQGAYYQQARNPSDKQTLITVAAEIGLDAQLFAAELVSPAVERILQENFQFKNSLGVQGFPTLVLQKDKQFYALTVGYVEADTILQQLEHVLALEPGQIGA